MKPKNNAVQRANGNRCKRLGIRESAAHPDLYKKLGLVIEDNDFNRRAKAYAELAVSWSNCRIRRGEPLKTWIVLGMKH